MRILVLVSQTHPPLPPSPLTFNRIRTLQVNHFDKVPAPLYLPEEAISHDPDERSIAHPELEKLFKGCARLLVRHRYLGRFVA